jgi:hypothetical protein
MPALTFQAFLPSQVILRISFVPVLAWYTRGIFSNRDVFVDLHVLCSVFASIVTHATLKK